MTGNPITELEYNGAMGGALFEMMNRVGYSAWCPGNHDFDVSQKNLVRLTTITKFPTLCANLVNDKGEYLPNDKPYVIIEQGELRIGIIGIMSKALYNLVNQNNLTGIKVLPPINTVQHFIDELDPRTDLLIALTHEGADEDSAMAMGVNGLDVIVGGHSHTRLEKPKIVNGVIIVQAGSNCENLGELNLTVENDHVVSYSAELIRLWYKKDRPQTGLSDFIDSLQSRIDQEYSEVIATLENDWVRGDSESGIGNFVTDAQRDAAGAQVAFMNKDGIRKDVPAGPLTKRDLFEVLPFRNVLVTFQLSGKELKSVMLHLLSKRSSVLTSGLRCRWKKGSDGVPGILKLEAQGRLVEDERMYICAASDYFVGEARRYLGLEVPHPIYLRQTLFAAVEEAARNAKTISSKVEHRIEEVP
jgi:2',3'-cyclic-nucleotide 2'-phosphodiesterase (5'-nucleotidase family)